MIEKTDTVVPVPNCFYFSAFSLNHLPTSIENLLYLDTTSIRTIVIIVTKR